MRTFAYYFDGARDILATLLRIRDEKRFGGVRLHVSATRNAMPGSAIGLFARPDPADNMKADGGADAYDWKETDERGLWFGLAKRT